MEAREETAPESAGEGALEKKLNLNHILKYILHSLLLANRVQIYKIKSLSSNGGRGDKLQDLQELQFATKDSILIPPPTWLLFRQLGF